jgi:predicted RNase H-like nuclease (RuvC/YqgF family)
MSCEEKDSDETINRLLAENAQLEEEKKVAVARIDDLENTLAGIADEAKPQPGKRSTQERLLLLLCRENRILGKALIKKRARLQAIKQQVKALSLILEQPYESRRSRGVENDAP